MKRIGILFTGIISGIFLGAFLWLVQRLTSLKVYTLLVNVDYIPVLKEWNMGSFIEFSLHLIVSVLLVFMLYEIFKRMSMAYSLLPYVLANGAIGLFLYGTTAFSQRTPDLFDFYSLSYWLLGHLLYGVVVALLIKRLGRALHER